MSYKPQRQEFLFFKRCGNCHRWNLKWSIKKQKIYVKQIKQIATSQQSICGRCRKVVQEAIKERNI